MRGKSYLGFAGLQFPLSLLVFHHHLCGSCGLNTDTRASLTRHTHTHTPSAERGPLTCVPASARAANPVGFRLFAVFYSGFAVTLTVAAMFLHVNTRDSRRDDVTVRAHAAKACHCKYRCTNKLSIVQI